MDPPPAPERTTPSGLLSRLLRVRVAAMFVRNTVVSCGAFALDIALLWALVELLGVQYLVAATIAYLVAISIHYALARVWIFPGSDRQLGSGYFYFLVNSGIGLVITIVLYAGFVELLGMNYLVARVVVSVFAGLAVFLLNAILNFRSV